MWTRKFETSTVLEWSTVPCRWLIALWRNAAAMKSRGLGSISGCDALLVSTDGAVVANESSLGNWMKQPFSCCRLKCGKVRLQIWTRFQNSIRISRDAGSKKVGAKIISCVAHALMTLGRIRWKSAQNMLSHFLCYIKRKEILISCKTNMHDLPTVLSLSLLLSSSLFLFT